MDRYASQRVVEAYIARKKIASPTSNHDDFIFRVASVGKKAGSSSEFMKGAFLKYITGPFKKYHRKAHLFFDTLDDFADEIIKGIAPEITEAIRQHEVDADLDEFEEGAMARYRERIMSQGGYIPDFDPPRGQSEDYLEGYAWGDRNTPPPSREVKKRLVEEAAREHEEKVTERFVVKYLKQFWNMINPVEIIKHAFHFVKKHGWDVEDDVWYRKYPKRAMKMVIAGITMAVIEGIEHYALPKLLVTLTGNDAWWGLAAVPLLEIGVTIGAAFFRKAETSEKKPSHLEWYEQNFGDIDKVLEEDEEGEEEDDTTFKRASYLY